STTRRFAGTGLGLAITRALLEKMGGRIYLESEGEGKGTTVEFILPLAHPAAQPAPEIPERSAPAHAPGRKAQVLVVDDDPAIAPFIKRLLPQNKYEVDAVDNGADALDYLAHKESLEVCILDLMMPGTSGYDVLAVLKQTYGAPPPVVIVTN